MPPNITTFGPQDAWPTAVITPIQTHGDRIVEIISGTENLENCDGLWTRDPSKLLGIQTADCAPVVFIGQKKIGILHAGWRGICGNICEQMIEIFSSPDSRESGLKVYCGPILPIFEIQKDDCYHQIKQKFGTNFFETQEGKTLFHFQKALEKIFTDQNIQPSFDPRSTYADLALSSWRRDRNTDRNLTVVGDCVSPS